MQVKEAVQKASHYLPAVFDTAAGRELRLEGVPKSDDGRFWSIAFSYASKDSGLQALSREYKTVRVRGSTGEFMAAQHGLLVE